MRDNLQMIVHRFPAGQDEIEIVPIADVHLGAEEHRAKDWKQFCASVLERPNVYLILAGDLCNNAIKSGISNVYAEKIPPSTQKRMMAEQLKPLADEGRILACTGGNHEWRSKKEVDDDMMLDVCSKLNIEDIYRRDACFLKIVMGERCKDHNYHTFVIGMTHGAGGGIYTGASVNRSERFAQTIDGLDILVAGHTHKIHTTKPMKLRVDVNHDLVVPRPYYVVNVGSWMDYGGYAMRKMLLPSSPGLQIIKLGRIGRTIEVVTR